MRWQTVGVVVLVVVAVVLAALAFSNQPKVDVSAADNEPPSGPRSVPTVPVTSTSPSPSSTGAPSSAATDGPPTDIPDQRRVDFGSSTRLPDASRIYDNPAVGQGMGVREGVLSNGLPRGTNATSTLETELGADVRKVGARIRFSGANSGYAVLVAWQSSFVDARRAGRDAPPSGLRLVVTPTDWSLTVEPGGQALAGGAYAHEGNAVTFQVLRHGDTAWVIEPNGRATEVSDPRIAGLAGPWASWQLVEATPAQDPPGLEEVWAG